VLEKKNEELKKKAKDLLKSKKAGKDGWGGGRRWVALEERPGKKAGVGGEETRGLEARLVAFLLKGPSGSHGEGSWEEKVNLGGIQVIKTRLKVRIFSLL